MRIVPSLVCCLIGLAAGISQAFPFRIGRSMEYSVIRRGGAEAAVVTLLPFDTAIDAAGVLWKVQVKDSLARGVRASAYAKTVKLDTIEYVVGAISAWRRNACIVPWDPQQDGRLSLACANGISSISDVGVEGGFDRTLKGGTTSSNPMFTSSWNSSFPPLEGKWSNDSGWIALQEGVSQEVWNLVRIGAGDTLDLARRFLSNLWMDVHAGDRWLWRKSVRWWNVRMRDTTRGADSVDVRWTALERLGTSGVVGNWRFERAVGGRVPADTLMVDFDSPFTQAEPYQPLDIDLTVFRRGAAPSWYVGDSVREYRWSHVSSSMYTGHRDSTLRSYSFRKGCGVVHMAQSYGMVAHGPEMGDPSADTTITMELLAYNDHAPGAAGLRSRKSKGLGGMGDLERMLREGGRILSVKDVRGARVAWDRTNSLGFLRTVHGMLFVEAASTAGDRFPVRILVP